MPSRTVIELSGITLRLNGRLFFQNTCWALRRGENWLVTGNNGCGKTLLARAIAGEIPVVEGDISYHFRTRRGKLPEDAVVLVSFEQQKAAAGEGPAAERWYRPGDSLSVAQFMSQENVEEINPFEFRPIRIQTRDAFRKHRRRMVDLLQVRPLLRKPLYALSNGEMRKVLIARALLRKPRLLILDDALSGLDTQYRTHLKSVLANLMTGRHVQILLTDSMVRDLPSGITHMLILDNCRVKTLGPLRLMRRHARVLNLPRELPDARPPDSPPAIPEPPDREALVQLENVSVRYDGKRILSGIDWTIRRGESWALTGPNGSGKSTLLSIVNGDNPQAYANEVTLFGRRRGSGESVWEIKKRIGFVSSELHLHFPGPQSCIQTVLSGFREFGGGCGRVTAKQRCAAHRLLKRFGLEAMRHQPFHSLSTGLQRMVLLARALVKSPELLLLDEPCQGLDSANRHHFLHHVESLLCEGKIAIVYVTHRRDEIPKGIRKILKLRSGRVVRSGKFQASRYLTKNRRQRFEGTS